MPRCPHCRERFVGHPDCCPDCSGPLIETVFEEQNFRTEAEFEIGEDVPDEAIVSVARFHNAAEAGYFSHELMLAEEIPSMVKIDEHFDALSGRWSTRFLLLVPERFAENAVVSLQRLVEQSNSEESTEEETRNTFRVTSEEMEQFGDELEFDRSPAVESGVNWVPIVLTLAAGSAAFWGVQIFQARPQPQPHANAAPQGARQQDLWDRLSGSPEPWVQQLEGGRHTRRIQFETEGNVVIIREDSDGDGHFEKEHRIRRERLIQR
ncbi:MAG: hypothetical protein IID46_10085 [Planctomycetes bacterium]|nr:hypothetical protein [Planctomycetota bacterium]